MKKMFAQEYESKTGEKLMVEYKDFSRPGRVSTFKGSFHVAVDEEAVKIYERKDGRKHLRGTLWLSDTLGSRQTHYTDQLEIINHLDRLCHERLDAEDLGAEVDAFLQQRDFVRH